MTPPTVDKQRLDKWLWFARLFKTRTLAQKFVATHGVRIGGAKVSGPDYRVTADMVLTFSLHDRIRILRICAVGSRRGPATEAVQLYEDLSPPLPPRERHARPFTPALREPGTGRPTKKERRETDKWRDEHAD